MPLFSRTLTKLFPQKQPTTLIAGLSLTRDEAKILISVCLTLSQSLRKQVSTIQTFLGAQGNNSLQVLRWIHKGHERIMHILDDLVMRVKSSKEPWVKEFYDAKRAMERKVCVCNKAFVSCGMGWEKAAGKYWPLVCETDEVLLDLVGKLEEGLGDAVKDGEVWGEGANKVRGREGEEGRHVVFDKSVRGRWVTLDDLLAGDGDGDVRGYREFTTMLTSDRKNTAKGFSYKKAGRSRMVSRGREVYARDEGGFEEVNVEDVLR